MSAQFVVPEVFRAGIVDKLERLASRPRLPDTPAAAAIAASLDYVWACSAFAADACLRDLIYQQVSYHPAHRTMALSTDQFFL